MKRQLVEAQQRKQEDLNNITNIQEKRDALRRKLEDCARQEREAEAEVQEVQRECARELQIRQADLDDLGKLLEQKTAILDYFIPQVVQERLFKMATYDQSKEEWTIRHGELSGNVRRGFL